MVKDELLIINYERAKNVDKNKTKNTLNYAI